MPASSPSVEINATHRIGASSQTRTCDNMP
jgi:hypothetical protein